jgi:hypothetical protein
VFQGFQSFNGMEACATATTASTTMTTFTLSSLREAAGGGSKPAPNPFVFKKFAMHLKKKDVLKRMN